MFSHIFKTISVKYNMNKMIFFSLNTFLLQNKNVVCKNNHVQIETDCDEQLIIEDTLPIHHHLEITPKIISPNNYFRCQTISDIKYIELISCNFTSAMQTFRGSNYDVLIFENCLQVIYDGTPFTYYYKGTSKNHCVRLDNILYVFNNLFLVCFNVANKTFSHFFVVQYTTKNNHFEIVCKLPKNINYFIYFNINLENKKIFNKKLKKPLNISDSAILPYIIFYLAKNNFNEINLLINNKINYEKLIEYFSAYDNIFEVNNILLLTRCDEIKFVEMRFEENVLIDID